MAYWLIKSEPDAYSIDDLKKEKIACWDGVRNYQARNFMRDDMLVGDEIFYYHSNCKEPGIVGICKVVRESYPDHTAFDPNSKYHDPKSTPEIPRWFMVDIKFIKKFKETITLQALKQYSALESLPLIRKGNRLSVMPVKTKEWNFINKLAI